MPDAKTGTVPLEDVAGNGVLHRRIFLARGIGLIGAGGLTALAAGPGAAADPSAIPPWMRAPGAGMSGYGHPAKAEGTVTRTAIASQPGPTGSGASRTPLEHLLPAPGCLLVRHR